MSLTIDFSIPMKYHITQNGRQLGELDEAQIQEMLGSGQLSPQDLIPARIKAHVGINLEVVVLSIAEALCHGTRIAHAPGIAGRQPDVANVGAP